MELSPLWPSLAEVLFTTTNWAVSLVVAVASYRRSRHLSGYPIWKSLVIGVVAGACWPLWLIVWCVNRDRIAWEWREFRRERTLTPAV